MAILVREKMERKALNIWKYTSWVPIHRETRAVHAGRRSRPRFGDTLPQSRPSIRATGRVKRKVKTTPSTVRERKQ